MGSKASSAGPSQRGVGSSRKRSASPTLPTRASSRVKGDNPDYTGIQIEHRDGRIELASGTVVLPGAGVATAVSAPKIDPRLPTPFHRLNEEEETEAQDVDGAEGPKTAATLDEDDEDETPLNERVPAAVRAAAAALPKPDARDRKLLALIASGQQMESDESPAPSASALQTKGRSAKRPSAPGKAAASPAAPAAAPAEVLIDCTLTEVMAAKILKSKAVHLQFQPRRDTLLLAAGDSAGHVSVWHANRAADDPSDGVHLHQPHMQYISGLAWCPRSASALYSSSYDGVVRCLHVERQAFVTLHVSEEHEWAAFTIAAANAATLWLGTNTGGLGAVDARSGKACEKVMPRHDKKVNTLSLDQHGRDWLLASSSSDATVKVWDVRKLRGEPVATVALPKASQAAEWAPDGSGRLAITCFDDRLRIVPLSDLTAAAAAAPLAKPLIKHCTQTGRWVVPFRAIWTAGADALLCGGMKRTCEVFASSDGQRLTSLSSELMTAIPSRNAAHIGGRAVACATNSGRVHIYEAA